MFNLHASNSHASIHFITGGFWLFHRQPVAPAAALAEMKKTATGM